MGVRLGNRVRDKVSGFEGIAQSRHHELDGNIQIGIQPSLEPGKPALPDAMGLDEIQLEVIAEGITDIAIKPPETDLVLGALYEDQITGSQGILIRYSEWLNGCVTGTLQPKTKKKDADTKPETMRIPCFALKKVGVGVTKQMVKPETKKITQKSKGGPSNRVSEM